MQSKFQSSVSHSPGFACPPSAKLLIFRTLPLAVCSLTVPSRRRRLYNQTVSRSRDAPQAKQSLDTNLADDRESASAPAQNIHWNWELDFYSRPVLGVDGKKLWELIIVDTSGNFEHVEAIPNSTVNSGELRKRIQAVIDNSPVKPKIIRYFRSQMSNMITIAVKGMDLQLLPSRRTYALFEAIQRREKNVYPKMPGFKRDPVVGYDRGPSFDLDLTLAERLPDALRCEKFAFAQYPLGDILEFFQTASPVDYFGASCVVDPNLPRHLPVPGLIAVSSRAKGLAGWMSGVEISHFRTLPERRLVVLECGLSTTYRFVEIDDKIKTDVRKFEDAKAEVQGLHFLAIQKSIQGSDVEGFWLLKEVQMQM